MPDDYYYSGGRRVALRRRADLIAVRFREPDRISRGVAPAGLARKLRSFPPVEERRDLRLTLLRVPGSRGVAPALRALASDPDVELVTPVYRHEEGDENILITDLFICQFRPEVAPGEQRELHRRHHAQVVEPLDFAPNGFLLKVDAARGDNAVAVANLYFETGRAIFAHADFAKPRQPKRSPLATPSASRGRSTPPPPTRLARQWHLQNTGQSGGLAGADARVLPAWQASRGSSSIVIAVIDDGFDLGHRDFAPSSRIVSPLDVRTGTRDASPRESWENHGTAVLGVAGSCARGSGLAGVAPEAALMPIRLDGSERDEARALASAARNGAAVITCSWGPPDGAWWDPRDPLHRRIHPLPDVVAAAMRFTREHGRGGLGCLLVWAAGNGNESISNDGYAASPWVLAVAAVNHGDRRSVYSDHGPEVAISAPSSDIGAKGETVGGIWTTDRRGAGGYNPGAPWTDAFGGTSAAAPLVAGVAALVLSIQPDLAHDQLARLLMDTAVRCDPSSRTWKKRDGRLRSDWYGAGRVDASAALRQARKGRRSASRRS